MARYTAIIGYEQGHPSLPLSYIAPSPDVAAYWALLDILGPSTERCPSWLVVLRTESSGAVTEVLRLTGPEVLEFHSEARSLELPES